MLNKVTLIGNLGQDPEVRKMNNGDSVCNFSIATTESWKDKASGERKERTEWHRIVVFNSGLINGVIEPYATKGTKIYLEGSIRTRKWESKDGEEKYTTEIVLDKFNGVFKLLSSKGEGQTQTSNPQNQNTPTPDEDDDVPF